MPEAPARHHMVRVDPASWRAHLAGRPDLEGLPLVADWAVRGWPLVVRRPTGGESGIPLGLPLPPAEGKRRLSFLMEPSAILSTAPPPRLAAAASAAAAAWQPTLRRLVDLDPETRTFGSLAWQHLTGLTYLSPTSDIDLLWHLDGSAERLLAGLAAIDRDAPMRIDGECLGAGGMAVQWRELAEGTPEIMVKDARGVALMPRADFLAGVGC
ncbi:malonate decarboxylase holo-[acyl-carrier-protein] synthase [Methylobacterium sp. J-090]|uniref:malonate decarboxylase holo-[acyl-carrier-protein] synthase n=1 Tax=Methylobacterium sp. J-090 TaxID=2836666 RepID=UPI001FB9571C|nr:malonate decarboxylase holo-[acyl-carrier-protein] synthase [Methylobacterium sp. J-090]MCJ2080836.1 malonate decarboxylase holo-[acyl-carrier-protein] synthase [Methylobacterium sp. J-090]